MRFWIWCGISLIWTTCLRAEDLLSLADSLYAWGNHSEAITEYRRYLFFHPRTERAGYIWYRIGLAHKALGEWNRALRAFQRAEEHAQTDGERDWYRVERALIQMARGRWEPAQVVLLRVATFGRSPDVRRRAWFLLGVGYTYTFRWEEAERAFARYFSDRRDPRWEKVRALLKRGKRLKLKSPRKARLLSTFLPGLGQAYVGDWGAAINALALNGLASYLWGKPALKGRYADSAFWFLTLFWRYYTGNRFRAEKLAERRNLEIRQMLAEKVLDALPRGEHRRGK